MAWLSEPGDRKPLAIRVGVIGGNVNRYRCSLQSLGRVGDRDRRIIAALERDEAALFDPEEKTGAERLYLQKRAIEFPRCIVACIEAPLKEPGCRREREF